VSYASGNLYVYDHELMCCPGPPTYQLHKQGRGYAVYTCKVKGSRNPVYKWSIGKGCLNEFAFSPCGVYLACVSQDGYLRIFVYDTFELVGLARSYFGGLLCVCWSPDSKFIVFGGEDDLVNVYSLEEKRVLVRGQGHKSWVSVVAFDHFNISYGELPDGLDFSGMNRFFYLLNPDLISYNKLRFSNSQIFILL
jgi:WD40 repeat protein